MTASIRGHKLDLERSKRFSEELVDWVRGKGRILILTHDNPDPDSLAAAYALRHLFLTRAGKDATIAFGGIIGRGENRVMVRELEIDAVPLAGLDIEQFAVTCMVDTQPGSGNNSFPTDREVHVVIDHHPPRDRSSACKWVDIREDYGASATILFEYLLSNDVYLGTKLATILYYAIKSETQDLGREWSRADREAYLALIPLSNNRILYNITHPSVPPEYFLDFNQAIETSRIYDRALVFSLLRVHNPDIVAEMADFLLRLDQVDVVLGVGTTACRTIVSLRTCDETIVAGELMRKIVKDLGTGGGHGLIAGGQIVEIPSSKTALGRLCSQLKVRLLDALGIEGRRGRKLVRH